MVITAVLVLGLASCGDSGAGTRSITVFAAASLTDAFVEIADAFEAANPGVSVERNFAGSSSLREQIANGAPADVFASANPSTIAQLVERGVVDETTVFATNTLEIVVPAGNPGGVSGLTDLADGDLLVGLCAREVPCGELARRVLALAGVSPSPDTNEPDVRSLLTKVDAGELDVAIVYVTDVIAAGPGVEGIEIPGMHNAVTEYPIGVVRDTSDRALAQDFVTFVTGPQAQSILRDHGFGGR